jgi:2-iminobutanoate/2-iminopropanoate deaminase
MTSEETPIVSAPIVMAVTSDEAPTPTGPFHHATRHGSFVFTSGQAGRNRDTGTMGDVGEQVDWALRNIAAILTAAGSSMDNVLKVTLILRDDVTDMAPVNEAYKRHFTTLPARTSFFVSRLKNPDMLVEVEAVAVVC